MGMHSEDCPPQLKGDCPKCARRRGPAHVASEITRSNAQKVGNLAVTADVSPRPLTKVLAGGPWISQTTTRRCWRHGRAVVVLFGHASNRAHGVLCRCCPKAMCVVKPGFC